MSKKLVLNFFMRSLTDGAKLGMITLISEVNTVARKVDGLVEHMTQSSTTINDSFWQQPQKPQLQHILLFLKIAPRTWCQ